MNYFVKNLNTSLDDIILFSVFYVLSQKNMGTPIWPIKLLVFPCANDKTSYDNLQNRLSR